MKFGIYSVLPPPPRTSLVGLHFLSHPVDVRAIFFCSNVPFIKIKFVTGGGALKTLGRGGGCIKNTREGGGGRNRSENRIILQCGWHLFRVEKVQKN